SVCAFCNTVLLRTSPDSVLALYATLGSEIKHSLAHVLTTFVISQCLDLSLALVLSICLELLEGVQEI
ncbi:hypothetical protein BS17DRAFT_677861, partial [Gyrodon lividus]